MGKRLCNSDFSFLPTQLISRLKITLNYQKGLLIGGGQRLDRVMFYTKPFDINDFSLKLTKYLMLPNSHFCIKV